MGKKYIIELLDKCNSEFKGIMLFGLTQEKQISVEMIPEESMTPYIEPDLDAIHKEAYDKAFEDAEQVAESGKKAMYQKGLNDAREGKASCQFCEYEMCSDRADPCRICACNYTNFFEPKKQDNEEQIQVGDEVVGTYTDELETEPFVIIRKIPEIYPPYYFGIYSKSGEFCQGGLKLRKTGRYFPEIAEVLRKMKEDK